MNDLKFKAMKVAVLQLNDILLLKNRICYIAIGYRTITNVKILKLGVQTTI